VNDNGIRFECQACHEEPYVPRLDDLSSWARLCGYDSFCIRLCEEWKGHDPPPPGEELPKKYRSLNSMWSVRRCGIKAVQPPFLEAAPVAGKSYIASVQHPFIAEKGEPFWFLFQPPYSLLNGWEECPEEIYNSHLVHAVLDRVLHREDNFALIVVTVQEMISVPTINKLFPETTGAKVFSMFDDDFARRSYWARWLNYVYIYWNLESDVGVWWIFRQDQLYECDPQFNLVLQGHWGWHDALIWAGNQRVSANEATRIRSFMLR